MSKVEQMELRQAMGELSRQTGVPFSDLLEMSRGQVASLAKHVHEEVMQQRRIDAAEAIFFRRMANLMLAAGVPGTMPAGEAVERGLITLEQVEAAQQVTEAEIDEAIAAIDAAETAQRQSEHRIQ